jgi:hypothetical protein
MISEKEMQTDMKIWLDYWSCPAGIKTAVMEAETYPNILPILKRGYLIKAPKPELSKTLASFLKAAAQFTTDAASFPAFPLLRSIKKDQLDPDFEMKMTSLITYLNVLGVFRLEGLTPQELFELDREIAQRGDFSGRTTILMTDTGSYLPLTEQAYGDRKMRLD